MAKCVTIGYTYGAPTVGVLVSGPQTDEAAQRAAIKVFRNTGVNATHGRLELWHSLIGLIGAWNFTATLRAAEAPSKSAEVESAEDAKIRAKVEATEDAKAEAEEDAAEEAKDTWDDAATTGKKKKK